MALDVSVHDSVLVQVDERLHHQGGAGREGGTCGD